VKYANTIDDVTNCSYLIMLRCYTRAWASDGFCHGGALGDFSKIFPGGPKVVKFVFFHSKLRKQPFFAEIFKIQGKGHPCPTSRRPHTRITCHLLIYASPGSTRRNSNEKSKSSNNVASAKRCGNAVPTLLHPWLYQTNWVHILPWSM